MAVRLPRTETPLQGVVRESSFTQTELARYLKVGEAHVSRVVNGLHPTEDLADRLVRLLRRTHPEITHHDLWPHLYAKANTKLRKAA